MYFVFVTKLPFTFRRAPIGAHCICMSFHFDSARSCIVILLLNADIYCFPLVDDVFLLFISVVSESL